MSKKIGILCALEREMAPFLRRMEQVKTTCAALVTVHEGVLGNHSVAVAYSGVCKVNAAIAAQILISCFRVDVLINAGTCGGMDARLGILDTVVGEKYVYHDMDEGILTEYHPWMETPYFHGDAGLLRCARRACPDAYFGTMATGEQFIADDGRDKINRRFAPLCVDMETAAMAHAAYAWQIPFLSVRCVTDDAQHTGNDYFQENCEKAAQQAMACVCSLLDAMVQEDEEQC